jgi:hypothetical protein
LRSLTAEVIAPGADSDPAAAAIARLIHGLAAGEDWRPAVLAALDRAREQIARLTDSAAFLDHVLTWSQRASGRRLPGAAIGDRSAQ